MNDAVTRNEMGLASAIHRRARGKCGHCGQVWPCDFRAVYDYMEKLEKVAKLGSDVLLT